jgi:UDP-glucose 4-epimerase
MKAGVPRFLFSSPGSLNGAARNKPVDETGLFNLVTPYGESKATA